MFQEIATALHIATSTLLTQASRYIKYYKYYTSGHTQSWIGKLYKPEVVGQWGHRWTLCPWGRLWRIAWPWHRGILEGRAGASPSDLAFCTPPRHGRVWGGLRSAKAFPTRGLWAGLRQLLIGSPVCPIGSVKMVTKCVELKGSISSTYD